MMQPFIDAICFVILNNNKLKSRNVKLYIFNKHYVLEHYGAFYFRCCIFIKHVSVISNLNTVAILTQRICSQIIVLTTCT